MGVLNVTPDSFSGDGTLDIEVLVARGMQQIQDGAGILDVGGESTRPGATEVPEDVEMQRVLPLVLGLAGRASVPLSVDTLKPAVAEAALNAGAMLVNDVSGLRDVELARVAARHNAWLVITHNRWTARAKQDQLGGYYPASATGDIVEEVAIALQWLVARAVAAGMPAEHLILDPGLGFGKSPGESLELLKRTEELLSRLAPFPLLVGPSRKSFVGRALGLPVDQRLEGTLACIAIAAFSGAAIIRVHDVLPGTRAAQMAWAVRKGVHATVHSA